MARDTLPPLLRALGSTVLLAATITAFVIANKDDENRPSAREKVETAQPQAADLNSLLSEIHDLREEVEQKDVTEEVLKNPSFEWLSVLGTGLIVSSFYAEWYVRKSRNAKATSASLK